MAQQHATSGQLSGDTAEAPAHDNSSARVERFGAGVSAAIFLGGVVGVAAAEVLGGALPLLVALGIGFIVSPIVGLLVLRWTE